MQMESLPTFRKLWGHIDNDLVNGSYSVEIESSKINKN